MNTGESGKVPADQARREYRLAYLAAHRTVEEVATAEERLDDLGLRRLADRISRAASKVEPYVGRLAATPELVVLPLTYLPERRHSVASYPKRAS